MLEHLVFVETQLGRAFGGAEGQDAAGKEDFAVGGEQLDLGIDECGYCLDVLAGTDVQDGFQVVPLPDFGHDVHLVGEEKCRGDRPVVSADDFSLPGETAPEIQHQAAPTADIAT